jgi:FkbM family methyltransferase
MNPISSLKYIISLRFWFSVILKRSWNNIFIRWKTSDAYLFWNIFALKEYSYVKEIFKKDPDVIFDIWANVGYASIFFKEAYPNATIIAIEPEESNFLTLEKNLKNYWNIKLIKWALWDKNWIINLHDDWLWERWFTVSEISNNRPKREWEINAFTMNQLINSSNIKKIDLLKIDIEWAEKEVFQADDISRLDSVDNIVIETHDRFREWTSKSFFDALKSYNYNCEFKWENIFVSIFWKEK